MLRPSQMLLAPFGGGAGSSYACPQFCKALPGADSSLFASIWQCLMLKIFPTSQSGSFLSVLVVKLHLPPSEAGSENQYSIGRGVWEWCAQNMGGTIDAGGGGIYIQGVPRSSWSPYTEQSSCHLVSCAMPGCCSVVPLCPLVTKHTSIFWMGVGGSGSLWQHIHTPGKAGNSLIYSYFSPWEKSWTDSLSWHKLCHLREGTTQEEWNYVWYWAFSMVYENFFTGFSVFYPSTLVHGGLPKLVFFGKKPVKTPTLPSCSCHSSVA